ncbi:hypothetical protein PV11_00917 [Exophiala sideris]|uniref:Uncharacterized protein n=1 Tax=Exophiala sideris TaxID=1016849 RepID=A0A0D1W8T8_9EURO|nr:hypothetical protein PV11_00917 [Exophiala sideris]
MRLAFGHTSDDSSQLPKLHSRTDRASQQHSGGKKANVEPPLKTLDRSPNRHFTPEWGKIMTAPSSWYENAEIAFWYRIDSGRSQGHSNSLARQGFSTCQPGKTGGYIDYRILLDSSTNPAIVHWSVIRLHCDL